MNRGNSRILTSCAPPHCSCPTAEMFDTTQEIIIKDDYEGKLKLSYTQFSNISKQILKLIS